MAIVGLGRVGSRRLSAYHTTERRQVMEPPLVLCDFVRFLTTTHAMTTEEAFAVCEDPAKHEEYIRLYREFEQQGDDNDV